MTTNDSKKKNWLHIAIAFVSGVLATLLIFFAVNSYSDGNNENLTLVSSYEQFGFQEFNAEELESQDAYLAMLSMDAERKCLLVMLDNEILYEQAIIDYFEDILSQIPEGQYENDVSQIQFMLSQHKSELQKTLESQNESREIIAHMDELVEKYLKQN